MQGGLSREVGGGDDGGPGVFNDGGAEVEGVEAEAGEGVGGGVEVRGVGARGETFGEEGARGGEQVLGGDGGVDCAEVVEVGCGVDEEGGGGGEGDGGGGGGDCVRGEGGEDAEDAGGGFV